MKKRIFIALSIINSCIPLFSEVKCGLVPYASNNKYGLMDCRANVVLEPVFDYCYVDLSLDFYRVVSDSGYGIVNTQGDYVIHPKNGIIIETIFNNNDGYFIVRNKSGMLQGVINLREQFVLPMEYEKIIYLGSDCFLAKKKGIFYFINSLKNINRQLHFDAIQQMYTNELRFNKFNKVMIRTVNGSLVCLDIFGRVTEFNNFKLVNINPLNGDYIVRGLKGLGVLDSNMKELIPPIYKKVNVFDGKYYNVCLGHRFNLLNRNDLSTAFNWQKFSFIKLNDTLISKGSKHSKNVYSLSSPNSKLLTSDYKKIEVIVHNDKLYFLCQTKDSSYLFLNNAIVFKTLGEVRQLSNFYFVTNKGSFIDINGETRMEFDVEFFEIFGLIDRQVVLVDKETEYIYLNLDERKIISKIIKILD